MIYILLGVVGLCLGSFVNACVWRLHEQVDIRSQISGLKKKKATAKKIQALEAGLKARSISTGRSMCTHCGHQLAAKDLVPVLSWLSLRGKCRYCRKAIDDTPVAELGTAALFIASYIWWPVALSGLGLYSFIVWLGALVALVALFLYDMRWMILPNRITYPLAVYSLLAAVLGIILFDGGLHGLRDLGISLLISAGLFWGLFELSKGKWIGGGDVKLGVSIGALIAVPFQSFLVLFVASLVGTLIILPGLLGKKLKSTSHIPFGPFLIIATVIVKLFGSGIIAWYRRKFLLY